MNEEAKREMIYLAAYSVINRMLKNGIIDKESFDKLNQKICEKQQCKPLIA